MSRIIIYLVLLLPAVSSDLPESRPGKPVALCLVLLRMGFTCAPPVTRRAVVSYTAFPPLPGSAPQRIAPFRQRRGGIFLLHWPWSRLHRTLSGILPCEARTFLTCCLSAITAAITCLTCKYLLYHIFSKKKELFYLIASAAEVASSSHRSF